MGDGEVFNYPSDKVVFECAFDYLVKEVGREELVYICTREIIGKRLDKVIVSIKKMRIRQKSVN